MGLHHSHGILDFVIWKSMLQFWIQNYGYIYACNLDLGHHYNYIFLTNWMTRTINNLNACTSYIFSRIFIPRILARCARSYYHFRGSCSFEWLIRDLNTSKAIFSKCEYGLMYNLNNLAFVSWKTSINSTMKTFWCYTNLIKVCTLTMRRICVKISFSCVNPLVFVMGCILVIKPLHDNNITMATTA